jgi:hypothetical protein
MGYTKRILSALAMITVSSTALAVPFTFDARTLGMGGVSAATANLATAAWANPSMLTRQSVEDDFALLIGVGAFIRDNEDLIGDIDDFQSAKDRFDAGDSTARLEMENIVSGIEGKVIAPEATLPLALGIAFDSFSMAASVRADAIAGGTVTNISAADVLDENFNILNVSGVLATEFAVSFAKDFELFERRVSIGVKPKIVDLQAFSFSESILTVSAGIDNVTTQDDKVDLGNFPTVDLGLAMDLSENWLLGLNIRNLVTDQFEVGAQTLNFDTEAKIGVAYHNNRVTVAMDYDLTENQPLLPGEDFEGLKTQNVNIGAEFSAGDYVHLRVGAAQNLAGNISTGAKDTQYTVGIGFWLGFNLDVAFIVTEHSAGGMLQTGFSF